MIPTTRGPTSAGTLAMETARRGNYDSGEDFVLEYGELRFTFNEADFSERCEQAALKLGFVGGRLGEERARRPRQPRRQRRDPRPRLGARRARQRLLARARRPGRALARALAAPAGVPRRVARPARQGGRAGRRLRRATAARFAYVQPPTRAYRRRRTDRAGPRALVGPRRLPALSLRGAGDAPAVSTRCRRRIAAARAFVIGRRAVLADEQLGLERAAGGEVEDRLAARRGQRGVERDHGRLAAERLRRPSRSPSASRRRAGCARPPAPCARRAG